MVERLPVEDLLDDGILAVDAVVDGPDAAPPGGSGDDVDAGDRVLPLRPADRGRHVVPDERRRCVIDLLVRPDGVLRLHDHPCSLHLVRPGRVKIADPGADLPDALERLDVLDQAARGRIVDPHRGDAALAVHRVGGDAGRLFDVVLQEPVDDDHVAADELLPRAELLTNHLAVVGDHLEVEVRDEDAGVALAGRRLADVAKPALEGEVAALDRVLELGGIDGRRDRVDERRVAFELRELERGPQ